MMSCSCGCGYQVIEKTSDFNLDKYSVALCNNTFLPVAIPKPDGYVSDRGNAIPPWLRRLYGSKQDTGK